MAANVAYVYIYSNDGTRVLHEYLTGANSLTVTDKGCLYNDSVEWTYEGTNTFLGFATSPNAIEPTYAIGDSVSLTLGGSDGFYIVERETASSGVTVEYNGAVVATIPNGNTATLPVKDKKMKSDIVITVPEAEVLPEFTEVEGFDVFLDEADEGSITVAYSTPQDVKLPAPSGSVQAVRLASVSDDNFIPSNIKSGVSIFGLEGAFEGESSGGGAELNIAYGDTAPEDTSKLWVKTSEPSAVKVASGLTLAAETITKLSATRTGNNKTKELCSLPIDDKIYLAGGVGGTYSNDIRYFDIVTQTFGTISATMPVKDLVDCATTTFGSKFYLLGGYSYSPQNTSNSIYCLDTETGVITTLSATFPSARRDMGYATVGNKCYMFGGSGSEGDATIFCFDAENETLTQLSTGLPTGGTNWAASADGTIIYLITTNPSKDILAFDTETEKISVISSHTLNDGSGKRLQQYANKIYWRGYLYCLGVGYSTNSTSKYIVVNVADGTHRFSDSSYTFLNQTCACSVVNDIVYVFYETEVAAFKLPTDILLDTNTLQIQSASSNKFNLINTDTAQVEIGVNAVYKGNSEGIGELVEAALHNGTSWVTI